MAEFAHIIQAAPPDAPTYGALRKYTLLLIFCCSAFLDSFNVSALFSAIPIMTTELNLTFSDSVWLVSAYQLTFAALLLCSGRISDVYNPKYVFVGGAFVLGAFSIGIGFTTSTIALFLLRAFSGCAAAMTIPSSLTLLVRLFPKPAEQARAIGIFGGCAALGNVLGLVIGALLVEFTSWPWVFFLGALIAIPIAIMALILTPKQPKAEFQGNKIAYLDLPGISILTVGLVLLIFAFTSTGMHSWGSAMVLAPLVISIFTIAAFFFWEARIPEERAAFPPRTWRYPNFAIIFAIALSIFLWLTGVFFTIITMWQEVYHWSAISSAIHFLPIGLVAAPIMLFGGHFTEKFEKKWILVGAQLLIIISTLILPFNDTPQKYWSFAFPAFIIGAMGNSLLFVNANVAIFQNTPPEIAGTVGAIFNSALQLGSAVGVSVITCIQLGVDKKNEGKEGANPYAGRQAGFWFLLAIVLVVFIASVTLYRTKAQLTKETDEEGVTSGVSTIVEAADEKDKVEGSSPVPQLVHSPVEERVSSDRRTLVTSEDDEEKINLSAHLERQRTNTSDARVSREDAARSRVEAISVIPQSRRSSVADAPNARELQEPTQVHVRRESRISTSGASTTAEHGGTNPWAGQA